jgi:hypothetical protein
MELLEGVLPLKVANQDHSIDAIYMFALTQPECKTCHHNAKSINNFLATAAHTTEALPVPKYSPAQATE